MVKRKVTVEKKVWWQSKTMVGNVLALIAGILLVLSGELKTGGVLTFGSVMNIALRVVTKQAVKW